MALIGGNPALGLDGIQAAIDQGGDARQIARQMVDYLRAVLQVKLSQKDAQGPSNEMSESEKLDMSNYAQKAGAGLLLHGIRAFSTAISEMRSTVDSQLFLEMAYLECAIADEAPTARPQVPAEPSSHDGVAGPRNVAPKAARPEPAAQPATTQPAAGAPPANPPAASTDGGGANPWTCCARSGRR